MTPLFKSQFSVGKSILTAEKILDIAQSNSLERVVMVEDSFYGFRVFNNLFQESGIPLVFGLTMSVVNDEMSEEERPSKLVFFAKNNEGIKSLKLLYSNASLSDNNSLVLDQYSEEDFKNLLSYSPYHNIKEGACYPTTLITTSARDDRVVPAHSYKFAARLQEGQGCANPILLRVESRAGHGSGTPKDKQIEEIADIFGFALSQIN